MPVKRNMEINWKSPRESLPHQGERVLVACGPQPRTLFAWFYDNAWINDSNFRVHGVFAWATVPEPPTELAEHWAEFLPDRGVS